MESMASASGSLGLRLIMIVESMAWSSAYDRPQPDVGVPADKNRAGFP
jgi:hypothetical protein